MASAPLTLLSIGVGVDEAVLAMTDDGNAEVEVTGALVKEGAELRALEVAWEGAINLVD